MKLLTATVFMLLFSMKSNGQNKSNYTIGIMESKYFSIATLKEGSDTLIIDRPDKIHFIKIGDRVYKIESPTLREVFKGYQRDMDGNFYLDTIISHGLFPFFKTSPPKGTLFAY